MHGPLNVRLATFCERLLIWKNRVIKTFCNPPRKLRRRWFRDRQTLTQDDAAPVRDRLCHKRNVKVVREVPDNGLREREKIHLYLQKM